MKITDIDPGRADELRELVDRILTEFRDVGDPWFDYNDRDFMMIEDFRSALYEAARRPATCPTNSSVQQSPKASDPFPPTTPDATGAHSSKADAPVPKCGWTDLENEEFS